MERKYWLGRKRVAIGMAQDAATAAARLIHYELAGLYGIKAARSPRPFMLPLKGPATIGERAALRPPHGAMPPLPRLWPEDGQGGEART